jgi:hypothetical protein
MFRCRCPAELLGHPGHARCAAKQLTKEWYPLGREGMAGLATLYIILKININTRRNLHIIYAYRLRTSTTSPPKHHKTHTKLKRSAPRPWPDHGGTIPAQYRIYAKSSCPTEKAWRKSMRHGAPLQLHVFLVFCKDFLFSPCQYHFYNVF